MVPAAAHHYLFQLMLLQQCKEYRNDYAFGGSRVVVPIFHQLVFLAWSPVKLATTLVISNIMLSIDIQHIVEYFRALAT